MIPEVIVEGEQAPEHHLDGAVTVEVLSDPSRTGPTPPDQAPAQKPASEDVLRPDQQITGSGPADGDAAVTEAEGPVDAKLSPLPSSEERHVSFEEDGGVPGEEGPPKKKMNARERWYWAFDKIVGQLNVSTRSLSLSECPCELQSNLLGLNTNTGKHFTQA
nr:uncharacterized protein LOC128692992 isoform X2 [Cherax quadricarinatus]